MWSADVPKKVLFVCVKPWEVVKVKDWQENFFGNEIGERSCRGVVKRCVKNLKLW